MSIWLSKIVSNVVDFDGELGKSGYSYKEILEILYENCFPFRQRLENDKVKKIDFIDLNTSNGFASFIYKTIFEFEQNDEKFSIILKVPTFEKLVEAMKDLKVDDVVGKVHDIECKFYNIFNEVNDGFAPKCYYIDSGNDKREGMIIMEDLSEKCINFGFFRSGTIEQFWNVARKLAHFQAIVACMDEKKWKPVFANDFHFTTFHKTILNPLMPILAEHDSSFKPAVERFQKILSEKFSKYSLIDKPNEYGATTLCHGDFWVGNLMFEKNEDGSIGDNLYCFVDWQISLTGSPFFDLARFLISAFDAEIRREIQPTVVERFYEMLKEEYKKCSNGKIDVKFTLEQGHELFDLAIVHQTSMMFIFVPFVKSDTTGRNGSGKVLEAKLDKLVLRARLGIEDSLEMVEKHGLDGFAEKA